MRNVAKLRPALTGTHEVVKINILQERRFMLGRIGIKDILLPDKISSPSGGF
jgi:hypothetical protein